MEHSDQLYLTWWLLEFFRGADPADKIEFRYFNPDNTIRGRAYIALADLRDNGEIPPALVDVLTRHPNTKISFSPNLRVNTVDDYGTKRDLAQAFSFFVDADADDLTLDDLVNFDPQPTTIVQSSAGKYHAYWFFDDPLTFGPDDAFLHQYEAVQRGLAEALGCKWMNAAQLMGLPLTLNHKYDPPALRDVVWCNWRNRYFDFAAFPQVFETVVSRQNWQTTTRTNSVQDAPYPSWAAYQLENWHEVDSRNQAVYNVSIGLKDLGYPATMIREFVLGEINANPDYNDFPRREIEVCFRSAFGGKNDDSLSTVYLGYHHQI